MTRRHAIWLGSFLMFVLYLGILIVPAAMVGEVDC